MSGDPYKYFRIEARELLEQLGQGALELERGRPSADLVARMLRLAHTLKGAARVVKQPEIAELAHAVEDTLSPLREDKSPTTREVVDSILARLDAIAAQVAGLSPPGQEAAAPAPVEEPLLGSRAAASEIDALLERMGEAHVQLGGLRKAVASLERAGPLANQMIEAHSGSRVRGLADELLALVRGAASGLGAGVERLERELEQARDAAALLKLVPASSIFAALERVSRDTAQLVRRSVQFRARGGEVRLDAAVLGVVQGAMVQLVRNAIAHGIEAEQERIDSGKPATGCVEIEVARRGSHVLFSCRDDGRGLDLDALQRAAQRKGRLEAGRSYAAPELIDLLLRGGLTTSGAVTEVSGRGVGLDVVRHAASKVGGEVIVRTEPARGVCVELDVPVSLASLDVLGVESAGVAAVIPADCVRRTLRLRAGDVARTELGDSIADDGRAIPFVPLSRALGAEVRGSAPPRAAVVIASGAARAAIGVDRLLGISHAVQRPLPALARAEPLVAGVSLDAEGMPLLVLDADYLVATAGRPARRLPALAPPAKRPILVIDDSLTTRMLEQSILQAAGYEVDLASSAEEALDKARQRSYALFLVDVEMPGMDGFRFVAVTRADPLLREVPAILVTSRSAPEDRRRGLEAGAAGYVVKSEFDQTALLDRIRGLVG